MHFSFFLQIKLGNPKPFFGTGVNELLFRIHETKSLSAAAREMHMSYTKAWKILHTAELNLGYSLTEKIVGGPDGGGSSLTEEGLRFMQRYTDFYRESIELVDVLFHNYFPEATNETHQNS
ncbi:winged helix-turn-helix domain-containing protein [Sphaerochaeta halotolerans]|jgi:molybdate transport system regulatory protein|uniref:LysR family transcriptional regulator n=1 Tax=Sphaerochaeta halotolerans TaxID=2293840 RepID=A0A372MKD1_9SPIR|nr:LysR family transcriptional regulator [Sphaerochaeta halotolerans]MBG0767882.1 LysR family transcriptional regulator [Spirochaetaceae bacterium]MDK2859068.1 molybdate transport system regulatory protein [Sphaerochaeta sp.]MXI85192.1 LysR family transcriptional regulator [Sphaerochaeta halotolerans]RFU95776.1 LysR family transcriptional regulator [Sphaerochaeta halotolerans]